MTDHLSFRVEEKAAAHRVPPLSVIDIHAANWPLALQIPIWLNGELMGELQTLRSLELKVPCGIHRVGFGSAFRNARIMVHVGVVPETIKLEAVYNGLRAFRNPFVLIFMGFELSPIWEWYKNAQLALAGGIGFTHLHFETVTVELLCNVWTLKLFTSNNISMHREVREFKKLRLLDAIDPNTDRQRR